MEHALLAVSGLLVNALFGGPRRLYMRLGLTHIAHMPMVAIRDIERRLNRQHRTSMQRYRRGWLVTVFFLAVAVGLGIALDGRLGLGELVLLALLLPVRQSFDIAQAICTNLRGGKQAEAKKILTDTAWRHHAVLDDYGLARAAIELLAVQFTEKIVSPLFWYILLGLPGLFACVIVTALRENFARPKEGEVDFTSASYVLHRAVHWLPSRIVTLFWLCASLFLASGMAARKALIDACGHATPQSLSLHCAAYSMGLSLGGPGSIYGAGTWVGTGRAKVTHKDVRQALYAYGILCLLLFVLLGALAM